MIISSILVNLDIFDFYLQLLQIGVHLGFLKNCQLDFINSFIPNKFSSGQINIIKENTHGTYKTQSSLFRRVKH